MAIISISDIYNPVPFNDAVALEIIRNNSFLNSGLIFQSSELSTLAKQGGRILNVPFWNPLSIAEPQYSTDTATEITPKNLDMEYMKVAVQRNTEAWAEAKLTQLVSGSTNGKGLDVVAKSVAKFWNTDINLRVSNTLAGVIADNVANDSGDMVYSIASESISGQSDATKISGEAVLLALATMGETMGELNGIIMHRIVFAKLQSNNLIDFIPDSLGVVNIPTYMGMRVFIDNYTTTATGSTDGTIYSTYLFGSGAIGYADASPVKSSVLDVNELAGTGEGMETLVTRNHKIIHPTGFDYLVAAGTNPAYATLATAGSWNRLVDRNQVKIACLKTN